MQDRLRRLRGPRPATPAAPANVPATSPAVGARAAAPNGQAAQVPEGSVYALGGNGNLTLLRSHGRRLLDGAAHGGLPCPGGAPRRRVDQ